MTSLDAVSSSVCHFVPRPAALDAPQIVRFKLEPDGATLKAKGRPAWALANLIRAGSRGCTPISHPGPRWAAYIFKLRKLGLSIEKITEQHEGAYPGHHARYVLRSAVTVIGADR